MIDFSKCNEEDIRESGIVYKSVFDQIQLLYETDKELAGELAIASIGVILTGNCYSDNILINVALKHLQAVSSKNKNKYEEKVDINKEKKSETMLLKEIADLYMNGLSQDAIANSINKYIDDHGYSYKHVTQQTISNRIKLIKRDYPNYLDGFIDERNEDNVSEV